MSNNTPNPPPPPPASMRKPFLTPTTKLKPVAPPATTDNGGEVKPGSLQWGLVVAGFTTSEAQDFCRCAGRKTFNQLRALPYDDIRHITEEILGFTRSHSMKVIELRAWYLDWTTKPADTRREINQALTEESFDEFLVKSTSKTSNIKRHNQARHRYTLRYKNRLHTSPLTRLCKTKLATSKWIQGTYPHSRRRGTPRTPFSNGIIHSAAKCS